MITKVFSPFFYTTKLEGHSEYKKNILPVIFEEYFKKNGSNTEGEWGCDCFTTFFDRDFVVYDPLKKEIQTVVRKMFEEIEMKPYAYTVEQMWFNAYGAKQSQEVHCHTGPSFSGIYYLQFEQGVHKPTTFMNPIRWGQFKQHNRFWNPELWNSQSLYHHYHEPEIEEGNVILFPSEMDHYVQPFFNSSTLRITCSFNVFVYDQAEVNMLAGKTPSVPEVKPVSKGFG
jgi:uncharacterized protein (TIGR02466 family)|tara:strand:+ start:162 stop:845 length:684 start_codon:yes stop_codon:yes gene_type:complete